MNNIKYELVNPERSTQLVKELQLSLDQKYESFFDSNCSKEEFRELKLNIQYIDVQLHNDHIDKTYLFKRWYRAIDMDILLYNEALCVLLGIPIDLAKAFIHADLSKEGIESELNECCTAYEFYNTNENDYLKRKYSHDSIDTKEFIEWAIEKRFIERLDGNTGKKDKKYGFDGFNSHRALAKKQNTEILVKALEHYTGKQTTNALLNSEETPFYKELINDLVKMDLDGSAKPSPKTLKNYLSEYNKEK